MSGFFDVLSGWKQAIYGFSAKVLMVISDWLTNWTNCPVEFTKRKQ